MGEDIPLPSICTSHISCEHVVVKHATGVAPVRDIGQVTISLQQRKLVIPEQPDDYPTGSDVSSCRFSSNL
jgi:hypothetical protein